MSFARRMARRNRHIDPSDDDEVLLAAITFYSDDWSRVKGVSIVQVPQSAARDPGLFAKAASEQAWRMRCNPGGNMLARGPIHGERAASIPGSHRDVLLTAQEAHALDERLGTGGALAPSVKPGDLGCVCCAKGPLS